MTAPKKNPPGIATKTLDRGFTLESVCYLHIGMIYSKLLFSLSLVYQLKFGAWMMRFRKPLWIELFRTVIRSPECFPQSVSRCWSWRRRKVLLLVISHLSIHLWSRSLPFQEVFIVPFLPLSNRIVTPIRNCSVNTELIYRMSDSEHELCGWSIRIEVCGVCFRRTNIHSQFGIFSHPSSNRTSFYFRSRSTTRSSMFAKDFGHLFRGWRIHTSGHCDFGILSNLGASSIFTWVYADTASASCPSQSGNLAITSITFVAVIWDAHEPCSVKKKNISSRIIFHNVTTEHDSAFVLLKFWL